jgi:hypothetical protein
MKDLKAFFTDGHGKESSKRLAGLSCILIALIATLMDLFHLFTANEALVNSALLTGTTLLGLGLGEKMIKK